MASKEGGKSKKTAVSDFIKYMSLTDGRDKVNRTAQYASRFILWYFEQYGGVYSTVQKVQNLESALTTSRKLFRMARTLDFFQKVVDALNKKDETEMLLEVLGYLLKSAWLLTDHIIWFGKIKVITIDTKQWGKNSAWCWLAANSTLTVRDAYKLQQLLLHYQELKRAGDPIPGSHLQDEIRKTKLQILVDICDVAIPLSSLGYTSKGLGAAGGVVSSVVGGYLVWQKMIGPK